MADDTCRVKDCDRPVRTRRMCTGHYSRWLRHGDPLEDQPLRSYLIDATVVERLDAYSERDGDCIVWTGAVGDNGYGRMQVEGCTLYAHRVSYEEHVAPIPDGLQLDHLCRNRACIKPEHLEPVTCAENVRRGEGHGSKTHCPHGHPYEGDNLRIHTDRHGNTRRYCRTCGIERARRWRDQQAS